MDKLKIRKDSLITCALFASVFALTFLVMRCIPLFGDDYYYVTFWGENFWRLHKEHYMLANGRAIVHFLATVFISIPPVFWQILNSAFLAAIATFAAKHFASGRASVVAALTAVGMITALDVDIVRESVYWLTGSFNYVYPFALLIIYWYLLCRSDKRFSAFLYILALFSAATTEQNGMMTLGITVLYLLDMAFVRKERVTARYICLLLPAVIGFCSVYFAPATFVRYGLETEKGMLEVIKEQLPLLYYNFISKRYMLPFICFNFAAMGIFVFKYSGSLWTKLVSLTNVPAALLALYISKTPYVYAQRASLIALLLITVAFALNVVCIFIYLIRFKPKGYFAVCTAIILAVGSQLMMSASPVSGSRTMLCGIFNLVIFDIGLISAVCSDKRYFAVSLALSLAFCLVGVSIYADTYIGYKTNYPVVAENEELIEQYKAGDSDELLQYTMPYPDHCWSMPYQSTYHLYYYKIYYGLPEDTQINWIEYK